MSVRPKKELGQHFLADENILGVIGRLARLGADDVVLEIGPGSACYPLPRRPRRPRPRRRGRSLARASRRARRPTGRRRALGRRARARPLCAATRPDQARRQPALQRRDAARGREPDRPAERRALVRDGAARGRRPPSPSRRPRRTGPSRCSSSSPRAAPGSIRSRAPSSARRRTSTRRSWPSRVPLPDGFARIKAVVEAAFAHRRKTLPNSVALAGLAPRERAAAALEAIGRAPETRARRSARPSSSPSPRRRRAPAPAKINLALVVGPAREDGKHEVATVLQRVDLGDRVAIAEAPALGHRLRRRHARP